MLAKAPCPRCSKSVAVKQRGTVPVVFRHKDDNGEWCSGEPKSSRELILDLVLALQDERAVLREYTAEVVRHIESVVQLSEKDSAAQNATTEVMRQVTDAINREVADAGHAARRRS